MKKSLIIFFVLTAFTGFAQQKKYFDKYWEETTADKAAYYRIVQDNGDGLFQIKDYYIDGTLQMEGLSSSKEKDVFEGEVRWYHKNGDIESLVEYLHGEPNGKQILYYNNKVFKSGSKHGDYLDLEFYYTNGMPKKFMHYKNDTIVGNFITYDDKGKVLFKINFDDTKLYIDPKYLEGDTVIEGQHKNNKKIGIWKAYDKYGQLIFAGQYKKGEKTGEWKQYSFGKLYVIAHFKKGLKNGKWEEYADSGKLLTLVHYKKDKKHGLYESYFSNGKLRITGKLKKNKKEGKWEEYYENGKLKSVKHYKKGKERGDYKEYNEDGQLIKEGNKKKYSYTEKHFKYNENGDIEFVNHILNNTIYLVEKHKYFDDRKLELIKKTNYDNNLINLVYFYPSGELRGEGNQIRKNGDVSNIGLWKEYYRNGNIKSTATFKKDQNTNHLLYHENGQLYKSLIMKKSKLIAVVSCFDKNGNPLDKGTFSEGTGTVKEYDREANLINVVAYQDGELADRATNFLIERIWLDSDELNIAAWHCYEHCNDKTKLNNAIIWVKRSIELEENYYNTDTYAHLLYKTGEHEQALRLAKKAKVMAKQINEDYNETKELIRLINTK